MKSKPAVYFFMNPVYGSSYLRGKQIVDKLKEKGYKCEVLTKNSYEIRNSIVFFIKNHGRFSNKFHKSNILIWDVIDFIKDDKLDNCKKCINKIVVF